MGVSRRVGWFVVWSLAFAILYHEAFGAYEGLVLQLTGYTARLFVPLSLAPHPQGVVVSIQGVEQPFGMPYDFFAIGINVIFAPALVLATYGTTISGGVRALGSILIMIAFHVVEMLSIVLFYLSNPENPMFSLGWGAAATTAAYWLYEFLDTMSYALFPFLAWMLVCPDVLGKLFRRLAQSEP